MGPDYKTLTAEIVSAYVSSNSLPRTELPAVIETVYSALAQLAEGTVMAEVVPPTPPVAIKKSINPDYLVSLEDGRRYQSLKRHLTRMGLTPEQYRQKWGLKSDYPMVAPNYSARRSEMARSIGLGRKRAEPEPAPAMKRVARIRKPKVDSTAA